MGASSPLPHSCQAMSHLPGCPPHLHCSARQRMIMEKQPAPVAVGSAHQQIPKSSAAAAGLAGPHCAPDQTGHRSDWHGAPSAVLPRDTSTSHSWEHRHPFCGTCAPHSGAATWLLPPVGSPALPPSPHHSHCSVHKQALPTPTAFRALGYALGNEGE